MVAAAKTALTRGGGKSLSICGRSLQHQGSLSPAWKSFVTHTWRRIFTNHCLPTLVEGLAKQSRLMISQFLRTTTGARIGRHRKHQRFSNPYNIYAPWNIQLNARASVRYSFPLMELSRRPRHSSRPHSWKFLDLLLDFLCPLSPRSLHIQYHGYLHLLVIIIQLQQQKTVASKEKEK